MVMRRIFILRFGVCLGHDGDCNVVTTAMTSDAAFALATR